MSAQPTPQVEQDAAALVARLIELSPRLTAGQRQAFTEQLQQAGLGGVSPDAASDLQRRLGHSSRDRLDLGRVAAMAGELAEVVTRIDGLVTDLWRRIVPNSQVRKTPSAGMTLSRFAAGDAETDRSRLEAELALLQKVTVSLVGAIKPAAGRFARRHLELYGAAAVEEAERDAGGRGMGIEARCWKRYSELCDTMDVEAYEREILQVVADEAERLARGRA